MEKTETGLSTEMEGRIHLCPICGLVVDELSDCACLPCEDCGLVGDASCIEDHGHIPDPVLIKEAASAAGVRTDVVYRWARNGWINSRKSADTRTAPVLVSAYQVFHFQPPKRGWPAGVKKCPVCGKALTPGHAFAVTYLGAHLDLED